MTTEELAEMLRQVFEMHPEETTHIGHCMATFGADLETWTRLIGGLSSAECARTLAASLLEKIKTSCPPNTELL